MLADAKERASERKRDREREKSHPLLLPRHIFSMISVTVVNDTRWHWLIFIIFFCCLLFGGGDIIRPLSFCFTRARFLARTPNEVLPFVSFSAILRDYLTCLSIWFSRFAVVFMYQNLLSGCVCVIGKVIFLDFINTKRLCIKPDEKKRNPCETGRRKKQRLDDDNNSRNWLVHLRLKSLGHNAHTLANSIPNTHMRAEEKKCFITFYF